MSQRRNILQKVVNWLPPTCVRAEIAIPSLRPRHAFCSHPMPGFPVKLDEVDALHAAFLNEKPHKRWFLAPAYGKSGPETFPGILLAFSTSSLDFDGHCFERPVAEVLFRMLDWRPPSDVPGFVFYRRDH